MKQLGTCTSRREIDLPCKDAREERGARTENSMGAATAIDHEQCPCLDESGRQKYACHDPAPSLPPLPGQERGNWQKEETEWACKSAKRQEQ